MDGLQTNRQRALAWITRYKMSLSGEAIVNQDLTFRSVNDQFCALLGVTRGELLDKDYTDLTPDSVKSRERLDATLAIEGKSPGYMIEREYSFRDGKVVRVVQLMQAVYQDEERLKFDFFIMQILKVTSLISAPPPSRKALTVLDCLTKYWHVITTSIGIAAWILYEMSKLQAKEVGRLLF